MSADNWGICPRCKADHEKYLDDKNAETEKMYGKVSSDEYLEKLNDLKDACTNPMEESLREDYEIGMDSDGELFISYRCQCSACDFDHSFSHKKQVDFKLTKEGQK